MDIETIEEADVELHDKLGQGSFGIVRLGVVRATQERIAVKIEASTLQKSLLEHEAHVLRALGRNSALPQLIGYGRTELYSYMMMQLLGDSLESKFAACSFRFSLQTLLGCGEQMTMAVAAVHSGAYVHRDIKPQNFLLGRGPSSNCVYLIDFGLARKYNEIQFTRGGTLTGTPAFASLNAHLGLSPSMRDDLESLAYVLLYFLKGRLPWHSPALPSQSEKEVRQHKEAFDPFQFVDGHPCEFARLLQYSRSLRFDQPPDYAYVLSLFRGVAKRMGLSLVIVPDWETEVTKLKRRQSICEWKNKGKKERRTLSRRSFRIEGNRQIASDIQDITMQKLRTLTRDCTPEKLFQGFLHNRPQIMSKLRPSAPSHIPSKSLEVKPTDDHCVVI